jgi:tryptophanyl-tRNA synthetase
VIERVAPIAERRAELEKDPAGVRSILDRGAEHAREVAGDTMHEVRKAIGLE